MKKAIYLDYAAATPLDPQVLEAMKPYFTEKFYNPSATYLASRDVRNDLSAAREIIAGWLGSRPSEIYFTAGATEANNLAIAGIMSKYPKAEVLISSLEHDSMIAPAGRFNCNLIASTPNGIVDLKDLRKKINKNTVLVSVMFVNNELGTVQPLREVAKIIAVERKQRLKSGNKLPIYFHSDAAQAGNYLDLHVSRLGVDMMSINGGKIYGPKQTGVLYVKAGIELKPIIVGGGQERNLRSGTENVAGFIGLAKALDIAQKTKEQESKKTKEMRDLFSSEIAKHIPNAQINGSHKHQSPHILHVTFPGIDNERMMMELDERGIQCAVGSACSASSSKPSHVLSAIGMSDELARASLRFSFGRHTAKKDIIKTTNLLKNLITNKKTRSE
jgi:cysteine desulfurase